MTNPTPVLNSIAPISLNAGSSGTTIAAGGSGLVPQSVVQVNGAALTTSFQSSTTLAAVIPASLLANARSLALTVFNPSPGGGTSNIEPNLTDSRCGKNRQFPLADLPAAGGPAAASGL